MTNPIKIIPTKSSASQEWIQWHKAMRWRYGLKEANILFVKAWGLRGGSGTKASTVELRKYMNDVGVKLDTTALEDVVDKSSHELNLFEDYMAIGKYTIISVAVIVIGGLGMLVYNVAKQPLETVKSLKQTRMLK